MGKQFGNREGANNRDKHPFLRGDSFEGLAEHTSEHKLMSEEEKQRLLAKHEDSEVERLRFEKLGVREQVMELKNGRSILERLKIAIERITGN